MYHLFRTFHSTFITIKKTNRIKFTEVIVTVIINRNNAKVKQICSMDNIYSLLHLHFSVIKLTQNVKFQ